MRNGRWFVERINRVSNRTAQIKLLLSVNLKGLVFKSVCCFFDIPIGCLAIFLLSLVIKILPIHVTSDTIAGDEFRKTEKPHTLFKIGIFGSLRTNFKSIRKGFIHSSKEGSLAEKWSGFFCFQSFANTSRLWLIINRQ